MKKSDEKAQETAFQDLLDLAVAAHQAGNFKKARILYEKLLDRDPKNPDAFYLLGGVYYQNKNPAKAAELIMEAIAQDPDRDYFYSHLALALNAMDRFDDTMDAFYSALAINPDNAGTYNMMGNILKDRGKLEDAVRAFEKAVELDSTNVEASHSLSSALLGQQQPDRAISVLKKLLEVNPNLVDTRNRLGKTCLVLGRIPEAIDAFEKCIEMDPVNDHIYQNLGAALEAAGRQKESAGVFQKAIAFAKDTSQAYHQFGNYLLAHNRNHEAVEAFYAAIKEKPDFAEAYNSLGIALKGEGRLEEAVDAYKKAIAINPNLAQTFNNLGVAFNEKGQLHEALQVYQVAATLDPQNPHVFQNLGILLKSMGKLPEAEAAFQQAIKSFPGYADAYHNLGSTLIEMGNIDLAREALEKAVQLNPGDCSARYMVEALAGTHSENAPPEYVKELFNQYSTRFDKHLAEQLSYNTPRLLRNAWDDIIGKGDKIASILDLGCGTGLAGEVFRDLADYLVGVDISENMIAEADKKGLYDNLHVSEIKDYLNNSRKNFHLVIAADVFVYFGNLEPVFSSLKKRLVPKGHVLFSTENYPDESFILLPTGRFAHSEHYIRTVSALHGFELVYATSPVILRKENEKPVEGQIFIMSWNG